MNLVGRVQTQVSLFMARHFRNFVWISSNIDNVNSNVPIVIKFDTWKLTHARGHLT